MELELGRLPDLFFAVHRLDFDDAIEDDTAGRFHVLNLVAGEQVEIESGAGDDACARVRGDDRHPGVRRPLPGAARPRRRRARSSRPSSREDRRGRRCARHRRDACRRRAGGRRHGGGGGPVASLEPLPAAGTRGELLAALCARDAIDRRAGPRVPRRRRAGPFRLRARRLRDDAQARRPPRSRPPRGAPGRRGAAGSSRDPLRQRCRGLPARRVVGRRGAGPRRVRRRHSRNRARLRLLRRRANRALGPARPSGRRAPPAALPRRPRRTDDLPRCASRRIRHGHGEGIDVEQIADRALRRRARRRRVFADLGTALGQFLAPWLRASSRPAWSSAARSHARGTSSTAALRAGLEPIPALETVTAAEQLEDAALLGAARLRVAPP